MNKPDRAAALRLPPRVNKQGCPGTLGADSAEALVAVVQIGTVLNLGEFLVARTYADDPDAAAIAAVAQRLNELREAWLNPPDLVRREPEVVPGFPDRIVPVSANAAAILKSRTLI